MCSGLDSYKTLHVSPKCDVKSVCSKSKSFRTKKQTTHKAKPKDSRQVKNVALQHQKSAVSLSFSSRYLSAVFNAIRLCLLVPFSLPWIKSLNESHLLQLDVSRIAGLLFLAKSWFQFSLSLEELGKQCIRTNSSQLGFYSTTAFERGSHLYALAKTADSSLLYELPAMQITTTSPVAELSEPESSSSGEIEVGEKAALNVTPKRVAVAVSHEVRGATPRRINYGLQNIDENESCGHLTPRRNENTNASKRELCRLFGDVSVERLTILEKMGNQEEFENEMKKLISIANEKGTEWGFRTSTAIQFAVVISK